MGKEPVKKVLASSISAWVGPFWAKSAMVALTTSIVWRTASARVATLPNMTLAR